MDIFEKVNSKYSSKFVAVIFIIIFHEHNKHRFVKNLSNNLLRDEIMK